MIKTFLSENDGFLTLEKPNGSFILTIKTWKNNNWVNTIKRCYPYLKLTALKCWPECGRGCQRREPLYVNNGLVDFFHCGEGDKIEYTLSAEGGRAQPLIDDLIKYSILKHEQVFGEKNKEYNYDCDFEKITIPFYKKEDYKEYIIVDQNCTSIEKNIVETINNMNKTITKLNEYIKNLDFKIKDLENTNNRVYLALQPQI